MRRPAVCKLQLIKSVMGMGWWEGHISRATRVVLFNMLTVMHRRTASRFDSSLLMTLLPLLHVAPSCSGGGCVGLGGGGGSESDPAMLVLCAVILTFDIFNTL